MLYTTNPDRKSGNPSLQSGKAVHSRSRNQQKKSISKSPDQISASSSHNTRTNQMQIWENTRTNLDFNL
jgi:hypothetical protein